VTTTNYFIHWHISKDPDRPARSPALLPLGYPGS